MPEPVYLGFDFGYKRIGVAVGQELTKTATPLSTLEAKLGVPDWDKVLQLIKQWRPKALVVGMPVCIDGTEQYTAPASRKFAKQLAKRFQLPVHLVDERLSTVEAKSYLFEQGGYRKIKKTEVDSIASCVILEQWLRDFKV